MYAGELEIRPEKFTALAHGRPLHLTARELNLLTALVERTDRSVDVYVGKLRQKLERELPGQAYIHTHFGFGYRFSPRA